MSRALAGIAALVLALATSAGWAQAAPQDGVVTGRVTNGTQGGVSPAGAVVTLYVFGVKEQRQVGERTAAVEADGSFKIGNVDRDPNVAFFLTVEHQGVSYSHPTPFQLTELPVYEANVQVFDTTTSDAQLQFDRANLLLASAEPGLLQVLQMGAIVNAGDRTFVTENPQEGALARGVRFGLPKGALGAQFQRGFRNEDVVAAVEGVQVVSPLKPGRHEYALSFQVPYMGDSADLTLPLPYDAGTFNAYVPQSGPRVESSVLAPAGQAEMGGGSFALHSASSVPRGTQVGLRVVGLPWGGGAGLGPNQLALVALGVALLVLGGGVLLLASRRGSSAAATPVGESDRAALEQERRQLVVRLAMLDERFASGEVSASAYEQERLTGKQRLVELTRALRGGAVLSAEC